VKIIVIRIRQQSHQQQLHHQQQLQNCGILRNVAVDYLFVSKALLYFLVQLYMIINYHVKMIARIRAYLVVETATILMTSLGMNGNIPLIAVPKDVHATNQMLIQIVTVNQVALAVLCLAVHIQVLCLHLNQNI
jgi:hypothetical protein